ncbi:MAG: hypothetical protein ABL903_09925 [Methylococcales bacterium]
MKRSNTVGVARFYDLTCYRQKVAYHEAGHATAIHFNSLKDLPPVFFQIIFKDVEKQSVRGQAVAQASRSASIKGGRLIQCLPMVFNTLENQVSDPIDNKLFRYTDDYRLAFEADIINLLIGPLAEAKYCAQIDDEPFHRQLLTIEALKYYGGDADLAVVKDYLQSYTADKQEQDDGLNHFLSMAFNFVNDYANWAAITRLADYILASNKNMIGCDEVAVVLDGI